jgi:hypothetical protein
MHCFVAAVAPPWFASRPELAKFFMSIASDTSAYSGRLQQTRDLSQRAAEAAVHADAKEYAGHMDRAICNSRGGVRQS